MVGDMENLKVYVKNEAESKASKTKKPFFSLSKGWYSYGDIE